MVSHTSLRQTIKYAHRSEPRPFVSAAGHLFGFKDWMSCMRSLPALLPQLGEAEAKALNPVIGATPISLHMHIDQCLSFHIEH